MVSMDAMELTEDMTNRLIIENYPGAIMIINKDCKIIYLRSDYFKNPIDTEKYIGSDLNELKPQGVFSSTPSLVALRTGETVVDYVFSNHRTPLITISRPTVDAQGDVQMVIAYSQYEGDLVEYIKKAEREKATLQLNNLVNIQSEDYSLITKNEIMKKILSQLKNVARTDSTVMLYGESGTGKEVLAKYIHANSNRSKNVFIPINCASIPSELMESELFGYEQGAFTGASKEGKPGIFELADEGTLYLDEIGEMPLPLQAKVLRVLERGEFMRIGGCKLLQSNARVIAATNRSLKGMVDNQQFRVDLYYRLNVITVTIPPIRYRPDDIQPLAQSFLVKLNQKYHTDKVFTSGIFQHMENYNWPGNVREIRNIVERLYITSESDILSETAFFDLLHNDLSEPIEKKDTAIKSIQHAKPDLNLPFREAVRAYERKYMQQVLERCDGNTTLAAKMLQMSRAGFYKKWAAVTKE